MVLGFLGFGFCGFEVLGLGFYGLGGFRVCKFGCVGFFTFLGFGG